MNRLTEWLLKEPTDEQMERRALGHVGRMGWIALAVVALAIYAVVSAILQR